eukprot:2329730-Rhodomonas_salina.1
MLGTEAGRALRAPASGATGGLPLEPPTRDTRRRPEPLNPQAQSTLANRSTALMPESPSTGLSLSAPGSESALSVCALFLASEPPPFPPSRLPPTPRLGLPLPSRDACGSEQLTSLLSSEACGCARAVQDRERGPLRVRSTLECSRVEGAGIGHLDKLRRNQIHDVGMRSPGPAGMLGLGVPHAQVHSRGAKPDRS